MSSGSPIRTRADRVAIALPPGRCAQAIECLKQGPVLTRLGICLLAAIAMWIVSTGWKPPFRYRSGFVPQRDIVARVEFSVHDFEGTRELIRQKRSEMLCVYEHDSRRLSEIRQLMKDRVFQLIRSESFEKLPETLRKEFFPASMDEEPVRQASAFEEVKTSFANDMDLAKFEKALHQAFDEFERNGLLEKLDHKLEEGSQIELLVHPVGNPEFTHRVAVRDVRIAEVSGRIEPRLTEEMRVAKYPEEQLNTTTKVLSQWLVQHLKPTMTLNVQATDKLRREVEKKVEQNPAMITYHPGRSTLALGGQPLTDAELTLLELEHAALVRQTSLWQRLLQSLAHLGMFIALYVLCGVYVFYREPSVLNSYRRFGTMMGLVVVTLGLCVLVKGDQWRAEIVPLLLFGMTVAIAYHRELALLLSASMALVVTISLGQGLAEFVVSAATVAASVLLLGRIRSRTRLIYVGLMVGSVAFLTSVGVCTLTEQAFGSPNPFSSRTLPTTEEVVRGAFVTALLSSATWSAFCSLLAGLLMTGLLPFIEKIFDVQTDISLLELGDAAHPLLQELVRRAPGTYNHSINVASIGEAAAEAIDANGLLVRVGAYFHDIGKMLKPGYYIENQGQDINRHSSLMPAMSTLVIIAHVKDGANLARQHGLPQSIIDFIEQHHGTTLVEYFYRQATKQSEADPDGVEVDETSFRYPGPKPQTKESAVLMLSDAVESASRTLVDPTPSRIENLVHDIAMKRLLDGQFEDCGLTLHELHLIEESLVKSLTAVYHGRVKYPDQQTA